MAEPLTTPAPSGFDRVARLVARAFGTPMAVVTRIDEAAQGFFACIGLEEGEVPLEESFCNRAVSEGLDLLVVEDATKDPRFADYGSVTGGMKIRFYAGAVFRDQAGRAIGAVAAVDTRPRETPNPEQLETLTDLAALAGELLEEERLRRENNARLQLMEMAESMAGLGHFRVEADRRVAWSDEVFRIHGMDPRTADPSEYSAVGAYEPEDAEAVRAAIVRALQTGEGYDARLRLTRAHGEERVTRTRARCEFDESGAVSALFGVIQDVTDAVRATEALERSEALYRLMTETATDVTARYRPDGTFLYLSPSVEAVLGYRPDDLVGRNCAQIIHPDDVSETFARMGSMAGASPDRRRHVQYRAIRADGSMVWLEASPRLIRDDSGAVVEIQDHVRDISVRKALEREQDERVETLKLAEQVAGLGHWRVDLKSQAVSWSDEVYRIHGVSPDGFDPNLGGAIDFYHPDDRAEVEAFIQRIVETGEPGEFQQRLIRADGEERRVISRAMLQRDDEGAPAALFGVFQDVTERIRAQEAAARAKDEFLSNMSHELRTPLTSVIGFAGLLKASEGLGEMERRYADRISTASEALLSVINDILDYSKLEAGAVEMDPQPFDLESWARGAIGLVETQCGNKGLAVRVDLAAGAPEALIGDEGRLRQVLLNFLSNACKFTAEGGVSVSLGGSPAAGGWRLRVAVTDTGVGIAEERIDALFERFTQADQSTTRTYGGTGLGLAISRRLIELMGGEIGATSRPGEGSTFWFEATLPVAGAIGVEAPQDGCDARNLGGARVLLVDDSAANRDMVGALLEGLGLEVDTATDGAEGVEALRQGRHDLVLMDVRMPGMDGLAATRAIRALDEAVAGTPIVALTANVQPEHVARCREAGMDDHVAKPVSPAALAETIARYLKDDTSVTACARRRPT